MNPRTLSSAQTFVMKYVFPTMWISGFGIGTLGLFLGAYHGHNDASPDTKWQFLAAWIAGTAFILWGCARLKRVRVDQSGLLVSNYLKEIRIPFDDIREVSENRWINIHPVTIYFRRSTPFGERVVFMPRVRLFSWRSHPVVGELQTLAHI